jgi:hypothetical protein
MDFIPSFLIGLVSGLIIVPLYAKYVGNNSNIDYIIGLVIAIIVTEIIVYYY